MNYPLKSTFKEKTKSKWFATYFTPCIIMYFWNTWKECSPVLDLIHWELIALLYDTNYKESQVVGGVKKHSILLTSAKKEF